MFRERETIYRFRERVPGERGRKKERATRGGGRDRRRAISRSNVCQRGFEDRSPATDGRRDVAGRSSVGRRRDPCHYTGFTFRGSLRYLHTSLCISVYKKKNQPLSLYLSDTLFSSSEKIVSEDLTLPSCLVAISSRDVRLCL